MANTTVTDALFMGNVTPGTLDMGRKVQTESLSFGQAMNDASSKVSVEKPVATVEGAKGQDKLQNKSNPLSDKLNDKQNDVKTDINKDNSDKTEKIADEISAAGDKIKTKIKDTLGVTDEEIEETMASMGIMVQDLINPDTLKEVMMELSGTQDSLELLTNENLYNGMQEVFETTENLVGEIENQFGLTDADIASILENRPLFEKNVQDLNGSELVSEKEMVITENISVNTLPDNANKEVALADKKPEKDLASDSVVVKRETEIADKSEVKVETANSSNNSKTFDFAEKEQNGSESQMQAPLQQQTTITVNAEGNVVETVQTFSESYFDAREIVSQVTESVRMNISADNTSMEMLLHPATLGTVNMQVSTQNGVVTAQILVQNEAVKSALEGQLMILQETFEERGQTVEAIEVAVANYDLDRGMNNNSNEQEKENALRSGKAARRRLKLDEISDEEFEELTEDEQVKADMMRREGNSVDFTA